MRIAVPAETDGSETRVAATPETVKKLISLGASVAVQAGAGKASGLPDADYQAAGAQILPTGADVMAEADIVLQVRRPKAQDLKGLKKGAAVLAMMDPYGQQEAIQALANAGANAFAMEFMPRITRAQVMDVLSSQANLAGYRA
ncbi:MAG: NAD(P)(+) transhydrogenase (Re/Si-specific) subunit alpha, partial [Alphaproteobacteria bacterium]|nr:NAD(P)(+) transhydrogenase (Re/Si-specific) subunit alpha [Alphaproteobacteria bacterium]